MINELLADPLCHVDKGISANLMCLLEAQFDRIDNILPMVSKPFCVFVGEDDTLISLPCCSRLDTVSASDDKQLISYPAGRHLLHYETGHIRLKFICGKYCLFTNRVIVYFSDLVKLVTERSPEPIPKAEKKRTTRANRNARKS